MKKRFKLPYAKDAIFGNISRAMQNALIGQITPNIREVAINFEDTCIYVHFYYEGEIKQNDVDNMHEIMDLFCLSFQSFIIRLRYFRIDQSNFLPYHQIVAYYRFEEGYNNTPYHIP